MNARWAMSFLWRNRIYIMGLVGWAMLAAAYPIDWQMPVYAEY